MSDFKVPDLVARFQGWTVVSAIAHAELTEVRVACSLDDVPVWVQARGVFFVGGQPPPANPSPSVGCGLQVDKSVVTAGDWAFPVESLIAGQVLDSGIIVVPSPVDDPVAQPTKAAERILTHGTLVWPPGTDLPDELRGFELLDGITRTALAHPSLVTTVQVDAVGGGSRIWDTFVTPWVAIETERHPDADDPTVVTYFPLSDVPSRFWERTGIGRHISLGTAVGMAQHVTARTTYLSDQGLVAGALAWDESTDRSLLTSDGPRSPMSLASELLRMLPGGDVDFSSVGKEVVRSE